MKKFLSFAIFFCGAMLFAAVGLSGNFNWDSAATLVPGIKYTQMEYKSPRLMQVFAVRVDLATPNLKFATFKRDENWGKPMPDFASGIIRTRRRTCRQFMLDSIAEGKNMVLAVNASPWGPWRAPWIHKYAQNLGLIVSDGEVVSFANGRPGFVQYKDGRYDLTAFKKGMDTSNIANAIAGFGYALKKGKCVGDDRQLAPRTGFGISKDRKYLYIFVVDGRQKYYSMGSTIREVGEFLKYFGSDDGINMDGGGSTTLIIREKGKIKKLNRYINGSERAVGGALGIYF